MYGLDTLFKSQHIDATNPYLALETIKNWKCSKNTANFYIKQAIDNNDEISIVLPDSVELARTTLAYLVQLGLKKKVNSFSYEVYEQMLARARDRVKEMQLAEEIEDDESDEEPIVIPVIPVAPTIIGDPTVPVVPVSIPPQTVTPSNVPPTHEHPSNVVVASSVGKRGRKFDPNSNANRAIKMYAESVDKNRETVVTLFMAELGLPAGTATTYYYNARNAYNASPNNRDQRSTDSSASVN